MSVRRVMGIETEYGIAEPVAAPSAADRSPSAADGPPSVEQLSQLIVSAYSRACADLGHMDDVSWDLAGDAPLHDPRHPELSTLPTPDEVAHAAPALRALGSRRPHALARLDDLERGWQRGTSKVLRNGARLYVDHAHPEYAAPEALGPREALRYDLAGEAVMRRAMARAGVDRTGVDRAGPGPIVYKNNVDGKGAAYGCHENYLVDRAGPFEDLVQVLVPFFVTRPVLVGAGRVGIGRESQRSGFQISQRADYVEELVGRHTTYRRPIINTRDEPHAEPRRHRRLHVIGGDANCAPAATLLKLGMTALVLWVVETGGVPDEWRDLALADPVAEVTRVSHDLTLAHRLELADGRRLTALEIQRRYLGVIVERAAGGCHTGGTTPDAETADVLDRWRTTIDLLARGWPHAAGTVEWATKLALLDARRQRDGLDWSAPELAAMDLQWGDLRPGRSLAGRLLEAGRLETIVPDSSVAAAEFVPPSDTRAWFRGELIRRFPAQVYSASWHSIVVEPTPGELVRIPMTEPLGGTRALLGAVVDRHARVGDLLQTLSTDPRRAQEGHPA